MADTLIEDLKAARTRRGLTQRALAAGMGTTQSAIARLEHADDARLSTIRAYGEAVGVTVVVTTSHDVIRASHTVTDRLAARDPDGALRAVIQLHDDLVRGEPPADLRHEPPSTGARTWDAAIAAVVERAAHARGEPVPAWTAAPSRRLDHPWFPLADILDRPIPLGLACLALASSPPEFAARGIHLDTATFDGR